MDFRTLTYFVTVAQEQNFTKAAAKLNLSQPPLSNQIKALEESLGVKLFIRGKRRLQLTEAGNLLLRRARQILELCASAREEIGAMGSELSGRISIGIVEGRAPFVVSSWIAGFREEYPLVQYGLWNGSGDDVLDQLSRGLVDIAVIAAPYDTEHLDGIVVATDPWVAMIPADSPLALKDGNEVELRELEGQPLAVPSRASRKESIIRWFESVGVEPDIICSLSNYVDAVALAEQNACISIFPVTTYTPNEGIVTKIITKPAKIAQYVLVWNKEQPPTGVAGEFVNYVRDFIEDDRIHSDRFRSKGTEFVIPGDAGIL